MSQQPRQPPLIPFMPSKDLPPFHLRPWTPAEIEQARRMLRSREQLRPKQ